VGVLKLKDEKKSRRKTRNKFKTKHLKSNQGFFRKLSKFRLTFDFFLCYNNVMIMRKERIGDSFLSLSALIISKIRG